MIQKGGEKRNVRHTLSHAARCRRRCGFDGNRLRHGACRGGGRCARSHSDAALQCAGRAVPPSAGTNSRQDGAASGGAFCAGYSARCTAGAEVLATPDFPSLFARGEYLTLNRSRYFLVEFAFEEDPDFTIYIVETIAGAGLIPVIAHPERYHFVHRAPDLVQNWRRRGALLQINKGSLSGRFGEDARYTATRLLTGRRASLIASDAHGLSQRTPILSHCQKAVEKLCGTAYSKELFVRMPARILDDLPPDFRKPPAREETT